MKHIYLNGVIVDNFEQLAVYGWDSIEWNSLETVQDKFNTLKETDNEVMVHINSMGGSVDAGFKIYDFIRSQQMDFGRIIHTRADGTCASIASVIYLSADKENRSITSNSKIMIHLPWAKMEGNSINLKNYADELEIENQRLVEFYNARTGADAINLLELMSAETELTPEQAIALGFASSKIETVKAVAFSINNKQQSKMNAISKRLNDLTDLVKKKLGIVNAELTAVDGSVISFEGETLEIGMTVTITVDGVVVEMTDENSTLERTLEDGSVVTITEYVVMDIVEAKAPEDVEALKSELEALRTENEELKASSTVALETITAMQKGIGKTINLKASAQVFKKNQVVSTDSDIKSIIKKRKEAK